jgi:hypothetical protein
MSTSITVSIQRDDAPTASPHDDDGEPMRLAPITLYTPHRGTHRREVERTVRIGLVLLLALILGGSTLLANPRSAAPAAAAATSAAAPSTCFLDGPVPPAWCRPLVGAAHGANSDPVSLENEAGRSLGVRRTFWTGSQVDSAVRTARADVNRGRVPWISFKMPMSWADMASGKGDAWARDLVQKLSTVGGPVWLAFHHEPEGEGNLDEWRAMQERLAPIVHRLAPNVAYTVILTGWNQLYGNAAYSFDRIWPRGVKIDIAGFDLYNEYGVTKRGRYDTRWPCMACYYYRPLQAWAAAHDVRWGIAEFGWTNEAARLHPDWLQTTYDEVANAGGVAFSYFNTTLHSNGSWSMEDPQKRRLFTDILRQSPVPAF